MAYPLPFVKVNALGHFGSSGTVKTEFWQAGWHLTKNGGMASTPTELLAYLTSIATDVSAYHSNSNVLAGTNCFLTSLNAALVGTDGKYVLGSLQPTTVYNYGAPVAGSGTIQLPWPTSCVISLRSLLLRGPASHGRIYWPAAGSAITGTTGVLNSTVVNGIATAAQTLVNALNTKASSILAAGTNVGLVSPVRTGFQSPVVQLGIGQRLDHMESRERDISEAYVFKTLTVSSALLDQREDEYREQLEDVLNPK